MFSYFLMFLSIIVLYILNIVRYLLNILWSIKTLLSNGYTRRLILIGSLLGYMLGKTVELCIDNFILKIPVTIVGYICMVRILTYYKDNMLNEELLYDDNSGLRIKTALSYLLFINQYDGIERRDRVEFIHDLWVYRQEKLYQRVQEKINKENIQGEDVKSDSDSDSETEAETEAETETDAETDAETDEDKFVKLTSSKSKNV